MELRAASANSCSRRQGLRCELCSSMKLLRFYRRSEIHLFLKMCSIAGCSAGRGMYGSAKQGSNSVVLDSSSPRVSRQLIKCWREAWSVELVLRTAKKQTCRQNYSFLKESLLSRIELWMHLFSLVKNRSLVPLSNSPNKADLSEPTRGLCDSVRNISKAFVHDVAQRYSITSAGRSFFTGFLVDAVGGGWSSGLRF